MGQAVSRGLMWGGSLAAVSLVGACGVSTSPLSAAASSPPRTAAVTSTQTWMAHVTLSTYQSQQREPPGGFVTLIHYVLAGKLIAKEGHDLPTTQVREDCSYIRTSGPAQEPFVCALVVGTGSRTYAAAGRSFAPVFDSLLTSTGGEKPAGSIKLTELGSSKQGATVTYTIRISAHPRKTGPARSQTNRPLLPVLA